MDENIEKMEIIDERVGENNHMKSMPDWRLDILRLNQLVYLERGR
jgi:hypothetical protein